jgi:hypothetical protein
MLATKTFNSNRAELELELFPIWVCAERAEQSVLKVVQPSI